MGFDLKPKLSMRSVKKRFKNTQDLESSLERRNHLEKLAVMNTGREIYVQISGEMAYADIADRNSQMGYTNRTVINIPADLPDQSETNLDEDTWNFLAQKWLLYHELGHVRWSDWPSFEDVFKQVNDEYRNVFKIFWNFIEDAAVNRFTLAHHNVKDDMRIYYENVIKNKNWSKTMSLNEATSLKLVEYIHPTGQIDILLDENNDEMEFLTDDDREIFVDEILPKLERDVPHIIGITDPVARNKAIHGLFESIVIYFGDSIKPGLDEDFEFDVPDDADDMGDQSSGSDPAQGGQDMPDVDMPEPDMDEMQAVEADMQQKYREEIEDEKDQVDSGNQQEMESIDEWLKVIDEEYDLDNNLSLHVPDDPPEHGSFNSQTMSEAERLSQPLATDLRQRLRKQRRSKKQTKKKSGKVDSKRAFKSKQGNTNIFKRTSKPDDKEYACMIILDRSGSMSSYSGPSMMEQAEIASGALAFALEEIGVSVGQLSLLEDKVMLEKDFPESVDDAKEKLFRGCNQGSTPLSEALALAKARLSLEGDSPFVIVVTDGQPDHRERYRDILDTCDFPVLGVYIDQNGAFSDDHMNESAYFHQLEFRKYTDVMDGVKNMTKKVMF